MTINMIFIITYNYTTHNIAIIKFRSFTQVSIKKNPPAIITTSGFFTLNYNLSISRVLDDIRVHVHFSHRNRQDGTEV